MTGHSAGVNGSGRLGGPLGGSNTIPGLAVTAAPQAFSAPRLMFLGGTGPDVTAVAAHSAEIFLIGDGANAVITGLSSAAGNQLDLTGLLMGANLTHDLSDLPGYMNIDSRPDGAVLSIHGPGGTASVALMNSGGMTLADLLSADVLALPPH